MLTQQGGYLTQQGQDLTQHPTQQHPQPKPNKNQSDPTTGVEAGGTTGPPREMVINNIYIYIDYFYDPSAVGTILSRLFRPPPPRGGLLGGSGYGWVLVGGSVEGSVGLNLEGVGSERGFVG